MYSWVAFKLNGSDISGRVYIQRAFIDASVMLLFAEISKFAHQLRVSGGVAEVNGSHVMEQFISHLHSQVPSDTE
jgi:hypothetical protein